MLVSKMGTTARSSPGNTVEEECGNSVGTGGWREVMF